MTYHQRELLRRRARGHRHAPTESERAFWQLLCRGQLGVVFRRQVVLQGFIADFYACSAKLIVEVDGSSHEGRAVADLRRDRLSMGAGYRMLRVSAAEVSAALPSVVARVRAALAERR